MLPLLTHLDRELLSQGQEEGRGHGPLTGGPRPFRLEAPHRLGHGRPISVMRPIDPTVERQESSVKRGQKTGWIAEIPPALVRDRHNLCRSRTSSPDTTAEWTFRRSALGWPGPSRSLGSCAPSSPGWPCAVPSRGSAQRSCERCLPSHLPGSVHHRHRCRPSPNPRMSERAVKGTHFCLASNLRHNSGSPRW